MDWHILISNWNEKDHCQSSTNERLFSQTLKHDKPSVCLHFQSFVNFIYFTKTYIFIKKSLSYAVCLFNRYK